MKKFDEINIIPFIDIMLVLLAIVLVTASFISQGKIKVNAYYGFPSHVAKWLKAQILNERAMNAM